MGIILENFIYEISAIILIIWTIYFYVTRNYNYWKYKGVPQIKPHFPFGCISSLLLGKRSLGEMYDKFYKELQDEPYFGVYEGRRPTLVVADPELIKRILIKDFQHFTDRLALSTTNKHDYINNHLFNLGGKDWRGMRLKLTPTFTSGKLKAMFHLMSKCGQELEEHLKKEVKNNPVVDVKDVLARFTLNIIATCAFGLEANSLVDKNSQFYLMGVKAFKPSIFSLFRRVIFATFPFLTQIYTPRMVRPDVSDFLTDIVKSTVEYRKENSITRDDFLDLLMRVGQTVGVKEEDLKKSGHSNPTSPLETSSDNSGLTIEEMTAQAFIFFAAGFETSASTMTFCLYELARHPDVQDRLYQEIKQSMNKHDGLTYQALQDMLYMDLVIDEALRLYASLSVLHRTCSKTYRVPETDLVLEKGQRVIIPAYAIHHNPKYYPDPYKFDPERFTPERVKERHPCVYLPFGEGSRMCIGMRFGLLETKIGLAVMVSNFQFKLSPETQVPIVLNKTSFVTQADKPILLCATTRT